MRRVFMASLTTLYAGRPILLPATTLPDGAGQDAATATRSVEQVLCAYDWSLDIPSWWAAHAPDGVQVGFDDTAAGNAAAEAHKPRLGRVRESEVPDQ